MEQTGKPKPGDWWCGSCRGLVLVTDTRPVPLCQLCGGLPLIARRSGETLVWAEPSPTHCAGPDEHRFRPNRVKVGYRACTCRERSGGHSTWHCWECGDDQEAPPCSRSKAEQQRQLYPGGGPGLGLGRGANDENRPASDPKA